MSEIKVNSIKGVGASTAALTINNTDGTCTANITSNGGAQLSNRNLCINGADMMVAQRGTSTTGLQNAGGVFTIDRFAHRRGGTWANAEWKDEQVDSGTGLFKKALKKTTTTAEGSAAASGKFVMIGHYLEAQNTIAAFGDGTAEAKSFTISFYVKASIATTYCLHVATSHLSTSKGYLKQFTVNSANTWERKTCTIQAITNSIGTVNGLDNGTGIRIHWVLDAPTRASSQAADTWFTFTDGDFGYPTGQGPTGYANTLNATFELGGVQVEAGSVATDLEHRSFAQELLLCQRYCQVFGGVTNYTLFGTGVWKSSTVASIGFPFMTKMRSQPSFSVTSPTNSMVRSGGTNIDVTSIALDINTIENVMYNANASSGGTNGHGAMHLGKGNTDTVITLTAEL